MKLYTLPGAPNPTKVGLYIAEKEAIGGELGIEQSIVNVFKNEQNAPEHLARNPFGTMPVLATGDGEFIIESLPIIEYLEELHPRPSMWGDHALTRAQARVLERVADVRVLHPSAGYVHATNSPLGLQPNEVIAANCKGQFQKGLKYLDDLFADGRQFVAGSQVTVADCTLQAALQFLRFRELEELDAYPNIARWSLAYRERPAVQAVLRF